MSRIPLLGGSYEARSITANAQRCVNLFPEVTPKINQAPVRVTHYPTPGLVVMARPPAPAQTRCTYRASDGKLYMAIGSGIYYVDDTWVMVKLGTILPNVTPVSMADNGRAIVIVDGTSSGYAINMANQAFGNIAATNFYGANMVGYVDTYLIFCRPNTAQMYISLSLVTFAMLIAGTAFDPLDIAAKAGYPDFISGLVVMHREIWLIGTQTTEVWYNSGAADFTFQALPGAFIEHGCVSPYSIASQDLSVYWLSQDKQGKGIVMRGNSYAALRISTHAIETEISKYETIADAIGYTYQQEGHTFYVLSFPAANKTWVFDQSTEQWHQRAWTDSNGVLNRHRAVLGAHAYGKTVVGDWENGVLYSLDMDVYTDNGDPISRIRAFPHSVEDMKRSSYNAFIADMETGTDDGVIDGSDSENPPVVSLRWSDDRGKTYSNAMPQSLGAAGKYLTSIQWNRTGMARDRVFELSWSAPTKTALSGAFVTDTTAGS